MSGETEKDVSGWTTDTLRVHTQGQIDELTAAVARQFANLRIMLDERYATQTKALDAAFIAQQTAMGTALTAADTAVQAALEAAEKAVAKAEAASEKRFDSVNEFRGQLADQAATFMPRSESEIRFAALAEAVAVMSSRLDRTEGAAMGSGLQQAQSVMEQQRTAALRVQVMMAVALIISVVAIAATVIIASR